MRRRRRILGKQQQEALRLMGGIGDSFGALWGGEKIDEAALAADVAYASRPRRLWRVACDAWHVTRTGPATVTGNR